MTKPENITTSLEMSKKLHEAGIEIETVFSWVYEVDINHKKTGEIYPVLNYSVWQNAFELYTIAAAPTFQELWNILPGFIKVGKNVYFKQLSPTGAVKYKEYEGYGFREVFTSDDVGNVTNAVAEALLWCKENGYLD